MPPKAKRDLSVVLFDIGVSENFYSLAKQCVDDIYSIRCISKAKSLMKFYIINCNATKNSDSNYTGIYERSTNFVIPKPFHPTRYLNTDVEPASCNIIDAIRVAVNDFESMESQINIGCSQIILLTDFTNFKQEGLSQYAKLLEQMNQLNVFVYVLVPGLFPKRTLKDYKDVANWSLFAEHNRIGLENAEYLQSESFKSIRKIADYHKRAVFCDISLGVHIVNFYKRYVMPQPFTLPLSTETGRKYPVLSFRYVFIYFFKFIWPKLCKFTSLPSYYVVSSNLFSLYSRCVKKLEKLKIRKTSQTRDYKFVKADDPTAAVEFYDIVRCFLTNGTLIPLTDDVRDAFKSKVMFIYLLLLCICPCIC